MFQKSHLKGNIPGNNNLPKIITPYHHLLYYHAIILNLEWISLQVQVR